MYPRSRVYLTFIQIPVPKDILHADDSHCLDGGYVIDILFQRRDCDFSLLENCIFRLIVILYELHDRCVEIDHDSKQLAPIM